MIAARLAENLHHTLFIGSDAACHLCRPFGGDKCADVGIANGVFRGETAVVFSPLCRCNFRHGVSFGRWHDIHVKRSRIIARLIQHDFHRIVHTCLTTRIAKLAIFCCPCQQCSPTGGKRGISLGIRCATRCGEELGVVVNLEFHRCGNRISGLILHFHHDGCHGGIIGGYVDFGEACISAHHLLGAIIMAEHLGVHKHAARGRRIEPRQIEHGFGLTSSQEVPSAVHPGFHPGMIVVGVRPSRGIHLACRDAHGTQGSHGKR